TLLAEAPGAPAGLPQEGYLDLLPEVAAEAPQFRQAGGGPGEDGGGVLDGGLARDPDGRVAGGRRGCGSGSGGRRGGVGATWGQGAPCSRASRGRRGPPSRRGAAPREPIRGPPVRACRWRYPPPRGPSQTERSARPGLGRRPRRTPPAGGSAQGGGRCGERVG